MECKDCRTQCVGKTPCINCKEPISKKAIFKYIVLFVAASLLFYWIGVVV